MVSLFPGPVVLPSGPKSAQRGCRATRSISSADRDDATVQIDSETCLV